MKKTLFALLAIATISFTSCKDEKKINDANSTEIETSNSDNTEDSDDETSDSENILADVAALNKAEKELKELPKFKGKEIKKKKKINIYGDGRIIIAIQDPAKPENVDEYTYQNGKWQEPQALQISGGGNMDDNTFPLSQVKFETANSILKQLEEKSKTIEGAEPVTTAFYNMNPATGEMRWISSVDGTRESYTAIFNTDGSLKTFDKN